jgi:hypothetical protein
LFMKRYLSPNQDLFCHKIPESVTLSIVTIAQKVA